MSVGAKLRTGFEYPYVGIAGALQHSTKVFTYEIGEISKRQLTVIISEDLRIVMDERSQRE